MSARVWQKKIDPKAFRQRRAFVSSRMLVHRARDERSAFRKCAGLNRQNKHAIRKNEKTDAARMTAVILKKKPLLSNNQDLFPVRSDIFCYVVQALLNFKATPQIAFVHRDEAYQVQRQATNLDEIFHECQRPDLLIEMAFEFCSPATFIGISSICVL